MYYRDTILKIDLDIIKSNVQVYKDLNPNKDFFMIVKSNGYSLGDKVIADLALEMGAQYVCVSSIDEAVCLRLQGYKEPILCLGYVNKEHFDVCKEYDITLSIDNLEHALFLSNSDINNLKCHIKIDTGMNRLGFKEIDDVKKAIEFVKDKHYIEGIYSHYQESEDRIGLRTDKQYARFKEVVEALDYDFKYIHIDNSEAALYRSDSITNAFRLGIGYVGTTEGKNDNLKQAVSLFTRTTICKRVKKDETVGYGAIYTFDEDSWLNTLPIGYADGFLRSNQNRRVYIDGEYGYIVGKICMDQCMVKTTKEYPTNTLVEIFGPHISLSQYAKENKSNEHISLCTLSERVVREYIKDGKIVKSIHPRLIHLEKGAVKKPKK